MLTANGAVYDGGSGFHCDAAGGTRSHRAIDYAKSRSIPVNVFYHLPNELVPLEWEANMHKIASGHRCGQIYIYAEGLMLALNDLHQCLPDLSEADDDDNLLHGSGRRQMSDGRGQRWDDGGQRPATAGKSVVAGCARAVVKECSNLIDHELDHFICYLWIDG